MYIIELHAPIVKIVADLEMIPKIYNTAKQ